MSELRERVARAIAHDDFFEFGNMSAHLQSLYLRRADDAIALIRRETLEEAARLTECSVDSLTAREQQLLLDKAAAIRALGEKHLTPQEQEAMHSALRDSVKKVTP